MTAQMMSMRIGAMMNERPYIIIFNNGESDERTYLHRSLGKTDGQASTEQKKFFE